MNVTYRLQGMLPDPLRKPAPELTDHAVESFNSKLRRLRPPEHTDWRALLRLDEPLALAGGIGPPPPPPGVEPCDGATQRAWWRRMLDKHTCLLGSTPAGPASGTKGIDITPVHRMLALLSEFRRREDEVFAHQLAEGQG